jgi:C4-dicarboxylate transporter, DctQ subunit
MTGTDTDARSPVGWLKRVTIALGQQGAWVFVIAAAITTWEVVMRYVFSSPTTWVHVSTTALCAIGFSLGGAYAMVQGEHVAITSVRDKLPPKVQRLSHFLGLACGLVYLGGLSYASVLQAWEAVWHFEGRRWVPESVPGPPYWPLPALTRVALAFGAVLFLLVVLRAFWRALRGEKA